MFQPSENTPDKSPFSRAGAIARPDPPRLTVDAAMMLVDERLRSEGSNATCTRAEMEAAFAYMTSARVATAAYADAAEDAIVVLSAYSSPSK